MTVDDLGKIFVTILRDIAGHADIDISSSFGHGLDARRLFGALLTHEGDATMLAIPRSRRPRPGREPHGAHGLVVRFLRKSERDLKKSWLT